MVLACLVLADLLWTFVWFPRQSQGRIFQDWQLPATGAPVLVLGAAVKSSREPTHALEARLQTALRLFGAEKVTWFLVSGDNRAVNYNEPVAMQRWLLREQVPPTHIVLDYAGRRTHDSLKRAQSIFGVRRLVVVTSDFHLPRALFIAQRLGIEAWGVPASSERLSWRSQWNFWIREYFARHLAYLDVWFPPHTLLGPTEHTPDRPAEEEPHG